MKIGDKVRLRDNVYTIARMGESEHGDQFEIGATGTITLIDGNLYKVRLDGPIPDDGFSDGWTFYEHELEAIDEAV